MGLKNLKLCVTRSGISQVLKKYMTSFLTEYFDGLNIDFSLKELQPLCQITRSGHNNWRGGGWTVGDFLHIPKFSITGAAKIRGPIST